MYPKDIRRFMLDITYKDGPLITIPTSNGYSDENNAPLLTSVVYLYVFGAFIKNIEMRDDEILTYILTINNTYESILLSMAREKN